MDEVNILRNRTFNDELRTLVNKVSSHEKKPSAAPENLNRKELIEAFHKLFYELKYLNDYNFSSPDFNPFIVDDQNEFDSGNYITEYLKKTGYSGFAVFEYQIENECYEVLFSSFDKETTSSMVISLTDNLYKDIISHENGFLLSNENIKIDKFLSKKFFLSVEENSSSVLYFTTFSFLTEKLQSLFNIKKISSNCSPILMIKLNNKPESAGLAEIKNDLEKNLSLPLFIYSDRTNDQLVWPSFQNLLYYIDYFQSLFSINGGGTAYIINTDEYTRREILISMNYLYSRIYRTLGIESVIFRISVNRIIIFTANSMVTALDNIMDEWNLQFNNAFKIDKKSINEIEESDLILKDFFA